jgi:transposase
MKVPTKRDREIHRFVCDASGSIQDAADMFGVSRSTVRRAMDRITEFDCATFNLELKGAEVAEVIGWLRNGNTTSGELANKITATVEVTS